MRQGRTALTMAYQSLYLKYRPQTFDDVIGQDHVCQTLRNALSARKVAHAYLFCGPRGTGKTTSARLLAKALCCLRSDGPTSEPCDVCDACVAIRENRLLDVVELDAASNRGIDEVRNLKEVIGYQPTWARYRIFIIDEVHQMTKEAFNALLKTLEEPPDHAFFVLATTDPQKVPVTILSRCQRFDFRRVPLPQVIGLLARIGQAEGFDCQEAALATIARLADGCIRDAITTLDQVVAYSGGSVTVEAVNAVLGGAGFDVLFELTDILARRAAQEVFPFVERLVLEGRSCAQVLEELLRHLRNLLVARLGAATETGLEADAETVRRYVEQSAHFDEATLAAAIGRVGRALEELRWNGQHRIVAEVALASIAGGFLTPQTGVAAPATPAAPPAPLAAPPPAYEATVRPAPEPPDPEPPPEDGSSAPAGNPAASDEWQRAVLAIHNARPALGAQLGQSSALESGDQLIVSVPGSFQLDKLTDALDDPEGRALIEGSVAKVYGRPLTIKAELGAAPPKARQQAATGSKVSAVDLVLEMFEGSRPLDDD